MGKGHGPRWLLLLFPQTSVGPIGVAITQTALTAGAPVRVIETPPQRSERLMRLDVEVLSESDDASADVVIDATGNADSMARAFARARFGGRAVWVGILQGTGFPLLHSLAQRPQSWPVLRCK